MTTDPRYPIGKYEFMPFSEATTNSSSLYSLLSAPIATIIERVVQFGFEIIPFGRFFVTCQFQPDQSLEEHSDHRSPLHHLLLGPVPLLLPLIRFPVLLLRATCVHTV